MIVGGGGAVRGYVFLVINKITSQRVKLIVE